jgi:hypothetical protein
MGTMRFGAGPVPSGKSAPWWSRHERYVCGGLILVLGGWIAAHPPPGPPRLPSAARARMRKAAAPALTQTMPPVWVDSRTGLYYFSSDASYGDTPGGRYVAIEDARAQGYRSGAKARRRR